MLSMFFFFFFQAEDGIRDRNVTGVQTLLFRSRLVPDPLRPVAQHTYRCRVADAQPAGPASDARAEVLGRLDPPEQHAGVRRRQRSEERRVGKARRPRWEARRAKKEKKTRQRAR